MSRQSEEILLQIPHVRNKKNDGTLYLMGERLGWMMKSKDAFTIMHKYTDIKSQKISPEGKPKIQLQVVLHDGSSTTFHFSHPDGHPAQIRERDSVKLALQNLLPKFKRKVNKELEERHRLLTDNPRLLQLYKDLVITQILSPEEFWQEHAAGAKSKSKQAMAKQEVGVSGAFLSEIKPQADGANGLKYNLTTDIMESIFKTYPAVRRKHLEHVPAKMTEQEFWTKFFQSHYFHRDRIHGHGMKDLFTECAKDDDKAIKEQLKAGVNDTVANIGGFSDKTLDENYGSAERNPEKDGKKSSASSASAANIVQQSIIKRFNQHSIMVMKATAKTGEEASAASNGGSNSEKTTNPVASGSNKRLHEKIVYEDLEDADDAIAGASKTLKLDKTERYLSGPTSSSASTAMSSSSSSTNAPLTYQEVPAARNNMRQELKAWTHSKTRRGMELLPAGSAVSALIDLSPGGALMKAARAEAQLAGQCPEGVQADLRALYLSLAELLRHFWACFPPTTPQLQEKAAKMYDTLRKFQQVKLRPFENELARNYSSMSSQLTRHINQMLEAAFRKHSTWKSKKVMPSKS